MDQNQHGNFIAHLNRDKKPGDKKPTFDGRLSVPGSDAEQSFALWAHTSPNSNTGEMQIMFNGRADAVSPTDAPMDQVAALLNGGDAIDFAKLSLSARQLVLFPNQFKADAPDKDRPDYWGVFNPGNGQSVVRISAWMRKDRYKNAMIAGATSHPLPGKSEVEQQDLNPSIAELGAHGEDVSGKGRNKGAESRDAR